MSVTVANYLLTRLQQLGVAKVFGVPGDFNLAFLDEFDRVDGIEWLGNANELNGAYAADGYARVKNGIAAMITTFGVGELSAMNGVAGSYSEHVGVVHIVGTPSTKAQSSGALLHHTLGNGDFTIFSQMASGVVHSKALLLPDGQAAREIDRVLRDCYITARPVYIGLPTDVAYSETDGTPLKTPIDLSIPQNDKETEDFVVKEVLDLLHKAERPIILADACAIRHRVVDEVQELMNKTNIPGFSTPMGKSAIDETHARYGGVYIGDVTQPHIKKVVEDSDLVLSIGALKSDFNSGSFSYHISRASTIEFHSDRTQVKYAVYPDIGMKPLLRRLIDELDAGKLKSSATSKAEAPSFENKMQESNEEFPEDTITHAWLWPTIGKKLLRKGDVVVTETGTSNFGILDTKFPSDVVAVSQVLWGSIGYSVGALLGAAVAAKEKGRRSMLWVGDGSLQLTVQEISTMIRHGLTPIIFVINNDGYTIERLIHGMDAAYNDINNAWQYQNLLRFFGAAESNQRSYKVETRQQLDELLADETFQRAEVIQLVEVVMPKKDAPRALKVQAELTEKYNSEQ
ncbi:hypothetical protein PYCC9005_003348 [Savitreella phatthalungensis]